MQCSKGQFPTEKQVSQLAEGLDKQVVDRLEQETAQDRGEPSPVPYSLIVQRPSPDLPQTGVEKIYFTGAFKELIHLTGAVNRFYSDTDLSRFIHEAFNRGAYRLEIVLADWSIKIYKHQNNP